MSLTIIKYLISIVIAIAVTALIVWAQIFRYRSLSKRPWRDVFSHKATFIVYVILRMLVIFSLVRAIFRAEIESVMYCVLVLVMLGLPLILESRFKVELSPVMEIIVFLFIYAAEILGELESYYVKVPGWDTALHTMNGFLCAAIGFCLFEMLNRSTDINIHLSPFFLALVAFCFSMTVGVLWEFFEFGMDHLMHLDMQKDFIIRSFQSVNLDPTYSNIAVPVKDITETIITKADGTQVVIQGGYLDLGIIDTMKDLMVNCVGAVVFCILAVLGQGSSRAKKIASAFIPLVKRPKDLIEIESTSGLKSMIEDEHDRVEHVIKHIEDKMNK